ncbi:MAG: CCA tRNA nucleotidyltransferase [Ruminococcus sp.]
MSLIPEKCKFIFEKLKHSGFECFAVGGCVRDSIMGKLPQDWDFSTNASPDEITACFEDYNTITVGKKYGTIAVVSEGETYEITTYRRDGAYSDSRHPDEVTFSSSIEDDLSRRDFTINSIAYSEDRGYIDPYGGIEDIKKKLIRATGDPYIRFAEDALRIIRGVRFASSLGFDVEENTDEAMHMLSSTLSQVHPQRLKKELMGIIMGDFAFDVLHRYADVLSSVIPEIEPMFNLAQNNPHHKYDVWTHTLYALKNAPKNELVRVAVFFHDIGKPHKKTTDEKGIDHFKQHPMKSVEITEKVLTRFAFPREFINNVCKLIEFHDERFTNRTPDIKRVLNKIGEELFFLLLEVSRADVSAQSEYKRSEKLNLLSAVELEANRIIAANECYSLKTLAVNGKDLEHLGFEGKSIGDTLEVLLRSVIRGKTQNNKTELILFAKSMLKNN